MQRQHLGVAGLITDPNVNVAVPEGALAEASECVIRRVGTIEPRPGFKEGDSFNAIETGLIEGIVGMFSYGGAVVAVGGTDDPSIATIHKVGGTDYAILTEDGDNLSWNVDALRAIEVRGNLYFATSDTPRKISAVGATQDAYGVGVIPPVLISAVATATPGTGVVGDDEAVGYRMVTKRQDAQGVITYSAPSGRVVARNTSGGAKDVTLTQYVRNGIAWDEDTQTGDKLQIYRTEPVAWNVDPGDDHFLIVEIPFQGVSGQGTFLDDIATERLGAPLYTNDDEEGADASNWRPPASKDLALYQGSLFYANQTDYARCTFARYAELSRQGDATGIGARGATVTYTNGSAVVSGFSVGELVGLEVGMLVWNEDNDMDFADHPDPVYVVSIDDGAGEITLSSTWTGGTGSGSITLADSLAISVGSDEYYFNAVLGGQLLDAINSGATDVVSGTVYTAVPELFAVALGIAEDFTNGSQSVGFRQLVIEALDTTTSFRVTATHAGDYNPALGAIEDNGTLFEAPIFPNRIGWSKKDEPDHYLLATFQDVGNGSPILRAISTRDAVWLLKGKGDGIYTLQGFGAANADPTTFRIDQLDSSTYLLHPNLACSFEDQVYAWTNKGLVSISGAGVIPLSAPVIGSDTRELETLLDHEDTLPGAYAVANPKTGEVIFGLPGTPITTTGQAAVTYVYNTRTRAFTTWFKDSGSTSWLSDGGVSCATYNLATRALWLGQVGAASPRVERLESESIVNADDDHSISITAIQTSSDLLTADVTIAAASGWTPSVGDLVVKGSEFGIVSSVADTEHFTVHRSNGFTATGPATAYERFLSTMQWRTKTADSPGLTKRFRDIITHFASWFGLQQWLLYVWKTTNEGEGAINSYSLPIYTRSDTRSLDHRALVPRNAHLASQITPAITIRQADSRWRINGLTLTFEPISSRVSR